MNLPDVIIHIKYLLIFFPIPLGRVIRALTAWLRQRKNPSDEQPSERR